MEAHLEVWGQSGTRLVPLEASEVSIGRAETNDVSLGFDPTVSRLHAVIVRYHGGWCLRDVGSANGTDLNGRRVLSEQLLRSGDEIRIGATRLVFRSAGDRGAANETVQADDLPPELTRREHDVLVALCRPLLGAEAFAQPASNNEIARELVVGEAAVKFHLANLYDKFALDAAAGSRRARLANEALRRGAVSRADLGR